MQKEKRLELYEKLYFHAGDVQEKLHARVQGIFAFVLIVASVIHYIIKNMTFDNLAIAIFICSSFAISSLFLMASIIYLTKAFWGNLYTIITTPEMIDEYYEQLIDTKKKQEKYNIDYPDSQVEVIDPDIILSEFYYEKMKEVSTENININIERQRKIHIAVRNLLWSLAPLTIGLVLFMIANMDSSAPRNVHPPSTKYIIINNPIRA